MRGKTGGKNLFWKIVAKTFELFLFISIKVTQWSL